MLRVGLTGDLGSGKTTVAHRLAERGAYVLSSDEIARAMMQPGEEIYAAIVAAFGSAVLAPDTSLDRSKLAALAFDPAQPRVEELNSIIHPAVIQAQEQQIAARAEQDPEAIIVIESALIFSTSYDTAAARSSSASANAPAPPWRKRFDCILLVTAPQRDKIDRFVRRMAAGRPLSKTERLALEQDATRRLALQNSVSHASECRVIPNDEGLIQLAQQVDVVWRELQATEKASRFSAAAPNPGLSPAAWKP